MDDPDIRVDTPESDTAARARFLALVPLARCRAREFEIRYGQDCGEFLTAAMLGAWRAAQTWDPTFNANLHTWGRIKIDGTIIDEFRTETYGRHKNRITLVSMDADTGESQEGDYSLYDQIPDAHGEVGFHRVDDHNMLEHLRVRMDARDWDILTAYYCNDEPQRSIGARYGVSESRICQILPGLLARARRIVRDMGEDAESLREQQWLAALAY